MVPHRQGWGGGKEPNARGSAMEMRAEWSLETSKTAQRAGQDGSATLREALTGCQGMRDPLAARAAKGSGAVWGRQKAGAAAYPAGTRALVTFGVSAQPSTC